MIDGARNSLGGNLYQFLGVAGLSARHATSRSAEVVHEQSDMDAVVKLTNGLDASGVQFKYSPASPPRRIQRYELIEILDAFYRSSSEITNLKFSEYVLISNRSFAPAARKLYDTRNQATPHSSLKPGLLKTSESSKKATKLFGDKTKAATLRHSILSKLKVELEVIQENWVDEVRTFASRYGLLRSEFEDALDRLIGRIFFRTVRKPLELTKEFLNECLLGVADARHLELGVEQDSACLASKAKLSADTSRVFVYDKSPLIRRKLIDEVGKQLSKFSLVFIFGNGGTGKSILAAQHLHNESSVRFSAFITANEVEENWLGRIFRIWRSPSNSHNLPLESIEQVVHRLRQANRESSRPILLLDLDGVDEVPHERRHFARSLIHYFWTMERSGVNDAVLLVTCRTPGQGSEMAIQTLLEEWLFSDVPRRLGDSIGKVFVGDFDDEELDDAAKELGADYLRRVRLSKLNSASPSDIGTEVLGSNQFSFGGARPIHPRLLESLRHPAMWGALVGLQAEQRHLALNEDPVALSELANEFLTRFCMKANRRRPSLSKDRVNNALRAICEAIESDTSELDREKNWIEAARGTMINEESSYLFDEAISYGLIVEVSRGKWCWRHGFVHRHFKGD